MKKDVKKGVLIVALVVTSLFGSFCIIALLGSLSPQQSQPDAEEWVFEKYFENRGNGVYHVNGSIWQTQVPEFGKPPEPRDPTRLTATEELATVIGQWRSRHPEFRVISIIPILNPPCLIIVTEPSR